MVMGLDPLSWENLADDRNGDMLSLMVVSLLKIAELKSANSSAHFLRVLLGTYPITIVVNLRVIFVVELLYLKLG